jgi:hypothetical protein
MRLREHARVFFLAAASLTWSCGPAPRFALRAPVLDDPDTARLARRPARRPDSDMQWATDALVLRPVSHLFAFDHPGPAHNVNALDEVPNSSWFTNRSPDPVEAAEGPCRDHPVPLAPFTITSAKVGGYSPGFFVTDAQGRRYALKFDHIVSRAPELSTAADTITSRLYWSLGYNVPCNRVARLHESDLRLGDHAYYVDDLGAHRRMSNERYARTLAMIPRRVGDGTLRVALSEFLPGEPLGPWPTLGVRSDDPNDRVPHEHRRELRGERILAAWVNHWDAREPNALDTLVQQDDGARVAHWMMDFGDTLGGPTADLAHQRRLGYGYVIDPGESAARAVTLGFYRPTYESLRIDPRAPSLGFFDVAHFEPADWRPWIPLPRFDYAQDEDLAWMARRIARLGREHLEAIVARAEFSDPAVSRRLVEILLGRRARLLRWSFERVSPIADVVASGRDRVCAVDLAVTSGVGSMERTRLTASLRNGPRLDAASRAPRWIAGASRGEFCIELPHDAPDTARDDDPARYVVLDLDRTEAGHTTRLSAHLYDLGPTRGFVLAGIER